MVYTLPIKNTTLIFSFCVWKQLVIYLFISQNNTKIYMGENKKNFKSQIFYKYRLIKSKWALDVGKSHNHMFREFFHLVIINFFFFSR